MQNPSAVQGFYSQEQVIDMLAAADGLLPTSWPASPTPLEKKKKPSHKAAVELAKKDAQIASLETSVCQKDYVIATLLGVVEECLKNRESDGKTEAIVKVRDTAIENYAKSLEEDAKREKTSNPYTGSSEGY